MTTPKIIEDVIKRIDDGIDWKEIYASVTPAKVQAFETMKVGDTNDNMRIVASMLGTLCLKMREEKFTQAQVFEFVRAFGFTPHHGGEASYTAHLWSFNRTPNHWVIGPPTYHSAVWVARTPSRVFSSSVENVKVASQ